MGYQPDSMTVIGVELEDLTEEEAEAKDKFQEDFSWAATPKGDDADPNVSNWPPDSLQARFGALEPIIYTSANGFELRFTTTEQGEEWDSQVGNYNNDFGGYAGFDISGLPLSQRGKLAERLPELASVIVARLEALGRPTTLDEVAVLEYEIIE